MAFTAQDVKALREKTGCGMMDCKKALTQSNGDMDAAIDFLREQGLAKQEKKSGRIAAEGVAFACTNDEGTVGVVIEVNAETDFVAKNADFQAFVKTCAMTVMEPCRRGSACGLQGFRQRYDGCGTFTGKSAYHW